MKKLLFILFFCPASVFMTGLAGSVIAGSVTIHIDDDMDIADEVETGGGKGNVNVVSTGCVKGSGIEKTEKRNVSSFQSVDVDGTLLVNITLSEKDGVEVVGDDNILPHIMTEVKGDTLFVTSDESICPKKRLEVNISSDDIERINSDGSHDVFIGGIQNKSLALEIEGSGDVHASGKTGRLVAEISGSGNIRARDLLSEEVKISIHGAGGADVHASRRLEAEIDGAGDIHYYGNPEEVSKKITGVGDIEKR